MPVLLLVMTLSSSTAAPAPAPPASASAPGDSVESAGEEPTDSWSTMEIVGLASLLTVTGATVFAAVFVVGGMTAAFLRAGGLSGAIITPAGPLDLRLYVACAGVLGALIGAQAGLGATASAVLLLE